MFPGRGREPKGLVLGALFDGATMRCSRHLLLVLLLTLLVALTSIGSAAAGWPSAWRGFQVVVWQPKTRRQYEALKEIGFTGAMVQADREGESEISVRQKVAPIVGAQLRPYVENIATDFYSAYHRWLPGKPVNAHFLKLQQIIAADPSVTTVFIRQPSLSDPLDFDPIRARIEKIARLYAPYRPLFFNLGDEMGIADLTAAWDFDFSPSSLREMRRWLKGQYGSLLALNNEWGTNFKTWKDVIPPTTTETMAGANQNFAGWSDFKEWMDIAFARAIRKGSEAVHKAAPGALAGMEGAQMPGWGGYNYRRIPSTVDVMELYDASQSLELARAFNPNLVTIATLDWNQSDAPYMAWHALLRGVRGMVVWDSNDQLVSGDGTLGPAGRAVAPFLRALKQSPATIIMASKKINSPIAVLYSPESYRLQWLLDNRSLGRSWTNLSSENQNADNAVRAARRRVLTLLASFGFAPHFVDEEQIAAGSLKQDADRIVILPQTLSLSSKAADALRRFVSRGGILITQGEAGIFDEHGRRLARPRLPAPANGGHPRILKLSDNDSEAIRQMARAFRTANIEPVLRIENAGKKPSPDIEHYLYRNGGVTIAAFLRNPARATSDVSAQIVLPHTAYVYDVRAERFLTRGRHLSISVQSSIPTVLAIADEAISTETCESVLHWHNCAPIPATLQTPALGRD